MAIVSWSQGHPSRLSHCRDSRLPPRAAAEHDCSSQGQLQGKNTHTHTEREREREREREKVRESEKAREREKVRRSDTHPSLLRYWAILRLFP